MDDLPDDFQDASGGACAGAGAGVEEVGVQTQLLLEEVGIQTEHLLEELASWEACTNAPASLQYSSRPSAPSVGHALARHRNNGFSG